MIALKSAPSPAIENMPEVDQVIAYRRDVRQTNFVSKTARDRAGEVIHRETHANEPTDFLTYGIDSYAITDHVLSLDEVIDLP